MSRLLHKRVKLRPGAGEGQSLVLFAILLPLLLLFLAVVVDAGKAFVNQRHLQNAADAASLAAAQYLVGGSPVDCTTVLGCTTRYVGLNSGPAGMQECVDASGTPIHAYIGSDPPDSRTCYQWPYYDKAGNPHYDQVLVWLYDCGNTWFGAFIGIAQLCESTRSVSKGSTAAVIGTTTIPGTTIPPSTLTNVSTGTTVIGGSTTTFTTTVVTTFPGITDPGTTIVGTTTIPGTTDPGSVSTGATTYPGTTDPGTVTASTTVITTTVPATNGAEAFALGRTCDAITYVGAGGGQLGTLLTNGGFRFLGNQDKHVFGVGYNQPGCPTFGSPSPVIGPTCTHTVWGDASTSATPPWCIKNLLDLTTITSLPVNFPLPPPAEPMPILGPWNAAADYPSKCINLGSGLVVISSAPGPPGIYCVSGPASSITINKKDLDLTTGDGYTFFALGGGKINLASNGVKIKFYWPSACGARPTTRGSFTCFGSTISNYDPQTLFYATNMTHDGSTCVNNAICVNGQGVSIEGDLFAPDGPTGSTCCSQTFPPGASAYGGTIFVAGGAAAGGIGFFEAWDVTFQGNTGTYNGTGPDLGGVAQTTTVVTTVTVPGTTNPGSTGSFTTTIPGTTNPGSTGSFTTTIPGTTDPGSTGSVTTTLGTTQAGATSTTVDSTEITIPGTTTPDSTQTVTSGTTTTLNIHE